MDKVWHLTVFFRHSSSTPVYKHRLKKAYNQLRIDQRVRCLDITTYLKMVVRVIEVPVLFSCLGL